MREEYQKKLNQIPKENLIYLDESGFDLNMRKEKGFMTIKAVTEKTKESLLFQHIQIKPKN